VQVQRGQARATAATARLDAKAGQLVLEGEPVLLQGRNRLEGRRITVGLHTGRIEVIAARGRFEVDLGGAP
ncbi:MAG TPA: LptA/OstA family protein, partial [Polyangia bacterium]|nr:LptA/OstA family protein [Polyangia bacterium]